MYELNIQDLKIVGGSVGVPGAVVGGAAGLAAYSGSVAASGEEFSIRDATYANGLGAMAGALTGPVGIKTAVDTIGISTAGGIAQGGLERIDKQQDGNNYDGTNY